MRDPDRASAAKRRLATINGGKGPRRASKGSGSGFEYKPPSRRMHPPQKSRRKAPEKGLAGLDDKLKAAAKRRLMGF